MDMRPNLELDMKASMLVISAMKSYESGKDFYRALCNTEWSRLNSLPIDERLVAKLKGDEFCKWSCSWRYAGGIVADIRVLNYNVQEDYMDYYCCGYEGSITQEVRDIFFQLGWEEVASD